MKDINKDIYLFHEGTNFRSYKLLGAHKRSDTNIVFRVWAPNAERVELVGDFNSWGNSNFPQYQMHKISSSGVWEVETENLGNLFFYKYKITNTNQVFFKSDPYAFFSETNQKTASIFYEGKKHKWNDSAWIKYIKSLNIRSHISNIPFPINIYELHLGSFALDENGKQMNYKEYADILAPYVKEMGYTHIELMPIAEHPFGASWGYQITGYYAPTSRFGTPDDFKYFIDKMHMCGIGVILDWVPGHFPKDESGLTDFDGGKCYEYQGNWKCEHKRWGTKCFDLGRPEVQSFLISNAFFWLEEFHIDGLRIDAVSSMLYLDYDRNDGDWVPNTLGTNENFEAISFLKKLNMAIHKNFPDAIIIAEESTEWKNVTSKTDDFGLGFDLKWNMGWMHDTLNYCSMNPYFRHDAHNLLTFSFFYAFSERFILPISHDEVVHGKKSLLNKFFGEYDDKFNTYKVFYSYMIAHPGKKMMFMGSEFGQFSEWNCEKSIEWFMTDFPKHNELKQFVKDINHFYLRTTELWELDFSWEGFQWIVSDDNEQNIIVFERKNSNNESLICIFNFSPVDRANYRFGVPAQGKYKKIYSTDTSMHTLNCENEIVAESNSVPSHGRDNSIEININGYTGSFYKIETDKLVIT